MENIQEWLSNLLPEVKTDVAADIDEAISKNIWKIGIIIFIAIVLAIMIGKRLTK